jgi:hypothetical protein
MKTKLSAEDEEKMKIERLKKSPAESADAQFIVIDFIPELYSWLGVGGS